jgi:hypothetical protein
MRGHKYNEKSFNIKENTRQTTPIRKYMNNSSILNPISDLDDIKSCKKKVLQNELKTNSLKNISDYETNSRYKDYYMRRNCSSVFSQLTINEDKYVLKKDKELMRNTKSQINSKSLNNGDEMNPIQHLK